MHEAGLTDASLINKPILKGFPDKPALCFPQQAQFHPIKYLNGLVKAIIQYGGEIYTNSPVIEIKDKENFQVITNNKNKVEAHKVVIATNAPIYDNSYTFAKQNPQRSYVIAASIPKGSLYQALYWDTEQPYHYIRIQSLNDEEELLIVGGEDHRTGKNPTNPIELFINLEQWSRRVFPQMQDILFKWSGQIQEPSDYKAFIGELAGDYQNAYIATGDSGNGITHGAIAGMLLSD
jgi:glycine/D-amino acid oxidase-like deaminating enzyme